MNYKSGEAPQAQDEVVGVVDGKPARGRVLAVRENGDVLITRRAHYSGDSKPLVAEHIETPADGLSLVYRPLRAGEVAEDAPAPKKGKAKAGAGKA